MGTPGLDALKTVLASNDRYADWCTIAVFIGLLIEYTILLWLKRKDLSRLDITLTILAGLAIAGGVYGEHHFGSAAASAAMQIENVSESDVSGLKASAATAEAQLAGAQRDAAVARKEADGFKAQIAQANADAAKAREQSAEDNLKLAKLQEAVLPRHITPEQKATFLKQIGNTREFPAVRIFGAPGVSDFMPFGQQLRDVLGNPEFLRPSTLITSCCVPTYKLMPRRQHP